MDGDTIKVMHDGRTVGWVFVDGLNVNEAIVEAGFAWHFKRYSSDKNLADAEKSARKKKIGRPPEAIKTGT